LKQNHFKQLATPVNLLKYKRFEGSVFLGHPVFFMVFH